MNRVGFDTRNAIVGFAAGWAGVVLLASDQVSPLIKVSVVASAALYQVVQYCSRRSSDPSAREWMQLSDRPIPRIIEEIAPDSLFCSIQGRVVIAKLLELASEKEREVLAQKVEQIPPQFWKDNQVPSEAREIYLAILNRESDVLVENLNKLTPKALGDHFLKILDLIFTCEMFSERVALKVLQLFPPKNVDLPLIQGFLALTPDREKAGVLKACLCKISPEALQAISISSPPEMSRDIVSEVCQTRLASFGASQNTRGDGK